MAEVKPDTDLPDLGPEQTSKWRVWPERWRWRVSIVLGLLLAIAVGLAWYNREQIASDFIDDALAQNGIDASYEIESIGTQRQVISNLIVGDPDLPDLTAKRVILDLSYTYGPPAISKIQIEAPRLFGTMKEGQLSFGSLDSLMFGESAEPAGLPELNLNVVDGRARIATDFGVVGAKLDGVGQLNDGFEGKLAATAPGLGVEGCTAKAATLFGEVTSVDGRLGLDGPLRLRGANCQGSQLATADVGVQMRLSQDLGSLEGDLAIAGTEFSLGEIAIARIGGTADVAWAFDGEFSLRHNLTGERFVSPIAVATRLGADGTVRSRDGFVRSEWTSRLIGEGVDLRSLLSVANLEDARTAASGTFAGELLRKLDVGLGRAAKKTAFAGDISLRTDAGSIRAVIPEARLQSSFGETLIALSRVSYNSASTRQPERLTGNILTGGAGLPSINARLQPTPNGAISLRMAMAEYRDGDNAISIPRLEVQRDPSGRVYINGIARTEGILPGGRLQGLELPIEGRFGPETGLELGTRCLDGRIKGLETNGLFLAPQTLSLCPSDGKPILRYRNGLAIAAQLSDLALAGSLGDSSVDLSASKATLRFPGVSRIEGLKTTIETADISARIAADLLEADLEGGLSGSFKGAAAALDNVPVDLSEISGRWSYSDDILKVEDGNFSLTDRIPEDALDARFEPLQGKSATLELENGRIRAKSDLTHPLSGREVVKLTIHQYLNEGRGHLHIDVPGIRFDESFQPDDLSLLTKGLIAFADGEIEGEGEIEWDGDMLTSGGAFSTNGFDFAAAFGPVRGLRGTIVFTDLLELTTRPRNFAFIDSVNPGIEALDGRIEYSITKGTTIDIIDGRWPFMGGELILRPTTLDYGGGQGQSYIFELVGLDAETFVAQMELANIGATGAFDGTIPIVFDAQGNGTIQGGLLISRPPGGNVSYIGELTYEDLGAMGNYAFQTLRSLDYNQMSIELNGSLAGEIVTNFNIDGVRQGEGASQNFVTRQLAKLPIRFKINVRSSNFYTLATIVRGMFDPTVFADAEQVAQFVGENFGTPGAVRAPQEEPEPIPAPDPVTISDEMGRRNEPPVQPPESENLP